MKTRLKNLFLLPALIAGLGLIPAGRVTAQTFTTLHSFTGTYIYGIKSDGSQPVAGLILSGNTPYGAAGYGGSSGYVGGGSYGDGTVFAVHTDGTGFTNLYSFTATSGSLYTNSDGANPFAGLILSGNTLYGTAYRGGSSGNGTVFAVHTDGTGFTILHSFTAVSGSGANSDGANPYAGLILSGNTLYGTAYGGGSANKGTVFAVHTDGTGFTILHSFAFYPSGGANPYAGLILSGNTLYGTTYLGGSGVNGTNGTVFAVNTDGTGFTTLHSFTGGSGGANPFAGLILSGNTLYGTAKIGGSSGYGTVFAVNTDDTGFTNLHSFSGGSDGVNPYAGLILSGNILYGTAGYGGSSGAGTVFAVHTNGTGFTNLYSFSGGSDGANPYGGLILSGNTLYGTAYQGGSSVYYGTVFSLSLPLPSLNIALTGNQSVLFWSASATNYILQSTTNLSSPNWVTASDAVPVIAFTVTNTSPARFFRLQQQP
jgi:uncharacterized repeat protein (TIGR03803 family)